MDEFYGTVAGFKAYHIARGRFDDLAYSDSAIGAALLVSSEWLDGAYRSTFYGTKTGMATQWREWPRTGVIDIYGYAVASDVAPVAIEYATYELALRQLQDPTVFNKDHTPAKYKSVSVDGAVSVVYANVGASDIQTQIPIIGQILAPLMRYESVSSLSGKVARA